MQKAKKAQILLVECRVVRLYQ